MLVFMSLLALAAPLAAAEDAAARAVLAASKQATGGAAWDRLNALHYVTRFEQGDKRSTRESWVSLAPVRYLTRTGEDARNGFDGTFAWREGRGLIGLEPDQRQALTGAYMKARAYLFPGRWPAKLTRLESRTLDGRPVDVVGIAPEGGSRVEIEFDQATHRPVREIYPSRAGDSAVKYDDFQETAGVWLPRRAEAVGPVGRPLTSVTESVSADPPLASGLFDVPRLAWTFEGGGGSATASARRGAVVEATVNGAGPFPFVLDSGGFAEIGPALANAAGLSPLPGVRRLGLKIGGLALEGVSAVVAPALDQAAPHFTQNGGPVGLLGVELFLNLVVAFEAGRVRFIAPEAFSPPKGATALPLSFEGGKPVVEARLEGTLCRLILDTGSNADVVLLPGFVGRHRFRDSLPEGKPIRTLFGTAVVPGVQTRGRGLALGSFEAGDVSVILLEADVNAAGFDGLVGMGVLGRRSLTLDYRGKTAYLGPD